MPEMKYGWEPLQRIDNQPGFERNPALAPLFAAAGLDSSPDDEIWINRLYQVTVRYMEGTHEETGTVIKGPDGMLHLSIHHQTRKPMRNWRHLQQIKNEVAGEERTAVEVFPPESALVDTSNEYHLWVFPTGTDLPWTFHERLVSSDEQAEDFTNAPHKGKQEPWEPGLTTGGDRNANPDDRLDVGKPGGFAPEMPS